MPRISVIVPVYRVESYLRRCVDSVLAQSFTDFDLVLVDDGSPDNCGAICDEYAAKDPRITVIHKENGGLSDARNAGIEWAFTNSDSEWITFIDSDDWVRPEYIDYLFRAVTETGSSLSICRYVETDGSPDVGTEFPAFSVETRETEAFFCESRVNAIVAWGKLYKKTDFTDIRFPVGKIHEDEFTTYKLLFKYPEIAVVNIPLYCYFINPSGIINSKWNRKRLALFDAIEEQLNYLSVRGFKKAYTFMIRAMNSYYNDYITELISNNPKEKKAVKKCKHYLKRLIVSPDADRILSADSLKRSHYTLYPKRIRLKKIIKRKIRHFKEYFS